MISKALRERFEEVIEIDGIDWQTIEQICKSDSNILRPIKGVAFEEYFKKILEISCPNVVVEDGEGDSDVDLIVNGRRLQLKTRAKGSTKENIVVGVSLHKTHGNEQRPYNLYSLNNPTFDFLVVKHPVSGNFIIPYNEIPKNPNWEGYLADPAKIPWDSDWLNNYGLLGLEGSVALTSAI